MRKINQLWLLSAILILWGGMVASAQQPYFTVDQMPDLIQCLPAPPAMDSPAFQYDKQRYKWGKQQRKNAESMVDSNGKPYGSKRTYELFQMFRSIANKIPTLTDEQKPDYQMKISAICEIMQCRKVEKTLPKP